MGLLDAVGYGLAQGTAGMAEDITAQIKSDIEMMRAETLMQSKQAREDQERIRRTGEIESRAGLINARKNEPIQKEGDTASAAYQKALDAGAIDEAGAESGKAAASEYVSKNTRPVDYVDRLEAASQLGYVDPEKMATLQLGERRADRQDAAAARKAAYDEAVLAIKDKHEQNNERKIDALISKSMGGGQSQQDKWQFAMKSLQDDISGFMKDKAAAQSALTGKDSEYLKQDEKDDLKGKIADLDARISVARKAKAKIGGNAGYELPDYEEAKPEKPRGNPWEMDWGKQGGGPRKKEASGAGEKSKAVQDDKKPEPPISMRNINSPTGMVGLPSPSFVTNPNAGRGVPSAAELERQKLAEWLAQQR